MKLDESCTSNPKSEILNWTGRAVRPWRELPVQFKISDFGFEVQDSSNFTISSWALVLLLILTVPLSLYAQTAITTPLQQFGHDIGEDYRLVNYTQAVEYWEKLDRESDRMTLTEIGRTAEDRPMVMAIVTSPENHQRLARYKEIAQRLARAEGLDDETARSLASEGKAVVWIDGGIHADEVLGTQQLIETVFQLVSLTDPETQRFLNDAVVLAVLANPDGMELVSNWYMREPVPERRTVNGLPRLYQKHAGHDNNRDFFMSALPETRAINRVLYREWFPQVVYDHHQTGPAGTVMFAPPFRDPFNFNFDPLIVPLIEELGAALQSRFVLEGKPGVTSRSGASYSTWWNGGLRTTPYFHNMIGLLTETIGNPTPIQIPFVANNQLPRNDLPFPIPPQRWHFRQSIDYSITANRAVLDYVSRNKDRLLFNIYRMARNSIDRGNRDSWTASPDAVAGAQSFDRLRDPARRDPRGFIVPSDQADFLTATKFINTLLHNGVIVHRATRAFIVNGKTYPGGSYVVKSAQAFRPHILDMFEPQDHPDDFAYAGAAPTPPYDNAGWTLAFQMGVRFDRILDGFDGPFEEIADEVRPAAGAISSVPGAAGYLLSHQTNDSFIAVNNLLQSGETVYWLRRSLVLNGKTWTAGTNFIVAKPTTLPRLQKLAAEVGLAFEAVAVPPDAETLELRSVRVGLWDRYGGSIPSGWIRLVLENFKFPFTTVETAAFERGRLNETFDVLILPNDRVLTPGAIAELRKFLENGGTVLAVGQSTALAYELDLPITNALADLPRAKFYVPGSILRADVDTTNPIAFGLGESVDLMFDQSPVFRLAEGAGRRGVRSVLWFGSDRPLRSGWAWGQEYLKDAAAVVEATVGKGKLVLFGPEILFRAQSHGTFKLLFNAVYFSSLVRSEPNQ